MKVYKYTIYRNGEAECFFWVPNSQIDRLNIFLSKLIRFSAKLMPTSNYQLDSELVEI